MVKSSSGIRNPAVNAPQKIVILSRIIDIVSNDFIRLEPNILFKFEIVDLQIKKTQKNLENCHIII
jgi:hypothetical protein